ncbi:MAG: hypothetical protein AAGB26_15830 [Planctomycetota bacterium]
MMNQPMTVLLAQAWMVVVGVAVLMNTFIIIIGVWLAMKMYHKPIGDQVLVRTGYGGTRVSFTGGILSYPTLHSLCRVYSGVILLKHPDTGEDWPVKLVLDEAHAVKARQSFGEKTEQAIKPALQAIADQHRNNPEALETSLASVGYAPVG